MKTPIAILTKTFLRGLATILPVGLTVYILWWIASSGEQLIGDLMERAVGFRAPGSGFLLAVAVVLLVGLLANVLVVRRVIAWGEHLLKKLPLVKTIYGPLKDMMGFFAGAEGQQLGKVVLVKLGPAELLGFVTRDSATGITGREEDSDRIAVYLPMSYQLGGFMVMVPRDAVEPLELSGEDGLRLAITAGITADEPEPASAP